MIPYETVYSKRRSIGITVKPDGKVIVRAPFRTPAKEIESVVNKHTDWILKHVAKSQERMKSSPEPTPEEVAELKRQAKLYFNEKIAYYSNIMGLKYGRVSITSAKTRFGSCSSKKNIAFFLAVNALS